MKIKAENIYNPHRYHLSEEAKKRLRWMYIIKEECSNNITVAARKIGLSRPWLSQIHSRWKNNPSDPRSLEPESRAPHHCHKRNRISREVENKIIEIRKEYHPWGKDKLSSVLNNKCGIQAGASTINRYLHKHNLIDKKISEKNIQAWKRKKENQPLKVKMRPPSVVKDYQPGALMEKDMKLVVKTGAFINIEKYRAKDNFWYQHTLADSFTRLRVLCLADDSTSKTATLKHQMAIKRLPFKIAAINNDNGSENGGAFSDYLEKEKIVQFYSRAGTPTDNPRVERSHLTDEREFYRQGNVKDNFEEQTMALAKWEYIYNYVRPHQALGNLTPMEFYKLWKTNPQEAYKIKDKYQAYLKKQSRRLATARKMKKKEEIENLMKFIDKKLKQN